MCVPGILPNTDGIDPCPMSQFTMNDCGATMPPNRVVAAYSSS